MRSPGHPSSLNRIEHQSRNRAADYVAAASGEQIRELTPIIRKRAVF